MAMLRKWAPTGRRNRLCKARVVISKWLPPGWTCRYGLPIPYIRRNQLPFLAFEPRKVGGISGRRLTTLIRPAPSPPARARKLLKTGDYYTGGTCWVTGGTCWVGARFRAPAGDGVHSRGGGGGGVLPGVSCGARLGRSAIWCAGCGLCIRRWSCGLEENWRPSSFSRRLVSIGVEWRESRVFGDLGVLFGGHMPRGAQVVVW